MKNDALTEMVIGCAIEVHRVLGPGFLESVYQSALKVEFMGAGIEFEREKPLPVRYKSLALDVGFRCDFLVEKSLIVECKCVKEISPLDQAQLLNYMKITGVSVGLILNFNVLRMRDGIKRMVNNYMEL